MSGACVTRDSRASNRLDNSVVSPGKFMAECQAGISAKIRPSVSYMLYDRAGEGIQAGVHMCRSDR